MKLSMEEKKDKRISATLAKTLVDWLGNNEEYTEYGPDMQRLIRRTRRSLNCYAQHYGVKNIPAAPRSKVVYHAKTK